MPISECSQNDGHDRSQLVVKSWNFFGVSLIKQVIMYLEMIFGKNKQQTMRQLQFKFDPLPTKSAAICLFHERWIKTVYTQPLGQLCIKHGLAFQKIDLVQFCNKYMVGSSQKNLIWGTREMENDFFVQRNENSLREHCLEFQDAPSCTILDHLNKVCHECGHKIDHLT